MSTSAAAYPSWKAPAEEGKTLVWPFPAQLLDDARDNHDRLRDCPALLQNIPLSEARRRQRAGVQVEEDQLLLVSGHQTELYHPGVWAKDALASVVAAKLRGRAWHVAIDTDQPRHLILRWPGGALPLSDDPNLTLVPWSGLIQNPTTRHLQQLRTELRGSPWNFQPMIWEFLDFLSRPSLRTLSLSHALTLATESLDESLGLKHQSLMLSPLLSGEPYLLLVHHLLARAGEFASQYNLALADYRRQHRIRTPARPMPDLLVAGDECEVPFWLDAAAGARIRATLLRRADLWTLRAGGGDQFAFDPAADGWAAAAQLKEFLDAHQLRLSPRALTLTLYLRLFLADQFIHGIGGARYDQVTDALIERFLGVPPPKFCVTTATLYFPGATDHPRACVPCRGHEGHRLRHQLLGDAKMEMVEQIDRLPRRSAARQKIFAQMRSQLNAAAVDHPLLLQWQARYAGEKETELRQKVLFDRELFYAIQPKQRLLTLWERYREQFAST
jgi:hypothetical protein